MDEIESIKHKDKEIKIHYDECYFPDYLEIDVYAPNVGWNYPLTSDRKGGDHYEFPLYMHKHSAISLSINEFECRWDSGRIGYVYIPKEGYSEKEAREVASQDLDVLSSYLNGHIYYYNVVSWCECCGMSGEILASIGGFYDIEAAVDDAKQHIDNMG